MPLGSRGATLVVLITLACVGSALPGMAATDRSGTQAGRARPPGVLFDFESGPARGHVASAFANAGAAPARLVLHRAGGSAKVVAGRAGGRAVRFPGFPGSDQGRAAVLVSTPGSRAAVDPGRRDFTFGASFRVDRRSSGAGRDNGDNLIQRGGYGNRGQFKIQLDGRVPSCRVKGDAGTRVVRARRAVVPNRWYAVNCRRTSAGLRLSVKAYSPRSRASITRVTGATGNIALGALRLSVGGKVGADGTPQASADQFTGAVDNAFLRLG